MSGNSESTANSIKFAPMPMSALLASLMPLQKQCESPDTSYTSDNDDSDHTPAKSYDKKPSPAKMMIKKDLFTPQAKPIQASIVNTFASEKKPVLNIRNKESIENEFSSRTYPSKDVNTVQSAHKNMNLQVYPSSVVKKHNVLQPQDCNQRLLDSVVKKTPEIAKMPSSSQKTKTATPKIKSGIRKFTPGSARRSHRKTPQKIALEQNRESVRCLFPENQKDDSQCLRPPVPETPLNRKPLPPVYSATPSYPQGNPGHNPKIQFKTTNIKGKKYMYIKKLGTGGSSEVYKVLEVGTSCEYAVKCVDLATDQELAQGYINEVRLLRELQKSDRVIKLYDYEYDRTSQFLRVVMEVGETDLSSFLKARGSGLPPALVLHYWEEMLHAVHYIHENGVIHADLKPANFMLVCGRLKLIDFGIASAVVGDATSVVRAHATGTYSYISPEALMGGAGGQSAGDGTAPIKISFRSDVWSLGCILYSMVYGRTPFGHIPNLAKLAAILDPNHRIDYPPVEHLPLTLIASLRWCLTYNVRSRPWVRELLSVPHLQPPTASLPPALLNILRPMLSAREYQLQPQGGFESCCMCKDRLLK